MSQSYCITWRKTAGMTQKSKASSDGEEIERKKGRERRGCEGEEAEEREG